MQQLKNEVRKVTVAAGDGVGPEITEIVVDAMRAVGAPVEFDSVSLAPDEQGGLGANALASLERTGLLLKGPLDPGDAAVVEGALRSEGRVFAHKQIYRTLPGVPTPLGLKPLNLTLVRELASEEPVEEHLGSDSSGGDVIQLRRTATRTDALRLCRYAFEVAARKKARRVTCALRLDQRRLAHGVFQEAFHEVAALYPHLRADEVPLNELAQCLLVEPEAFDVILLPEMEGDLVHELATGLVGGTSYAPSARMGERLSVFETTHGPLYQEAGLDVANPTALLLASTILLRYMELTPEAELLESALGRTLARMQSDPDVLRHARGFRTSIFRHVLLSEIRAGSEGSEGAGMNNDAERSVQAREKSARSAKRRLDAFRQQLDGLA